MPHIHIHTHKHTNQQNKPHAYIHYQTFIQYHIFILIILYHAPILYIHMCGLILVEISTLPSTWLTHCVRSQVMTSGPGRKRWLRGFYAPCVYAVSFGYNIMIPWSSSIGLDAHTIPQSPIGPSLTHSCTESSWLWSWRRGHRPSSRGNQVWGAVGILWFLWIFYRSTLHQLTKSILHWSPPFSCHTDPVLEVGPLQVMFPPEHSWYNSNFDSFGGCMFHRKQLGYIDPVGTCLVTCLKSPHGSAYASKCLCASWFQSPHCRTACGAQMSYLLFWHMLRMWICVF